MVDLLLFVCVVEADCSSGRVVNAMMNQSIKEARELVSELRLK